jgi:predicted nucleic acid-binding protein
VKLRASTLVIDNSVLVKWLLPDRLDEPDTARALALFGEVENGYFDLCQPVHWLAEASAVLARLSPATARRQIAALSDMNIPIHDEPATYDLACRLAIDLKHHLFDTLYHAVALAHADAVLLTADERYYRKAHARGRIARLADLA